MSENVLFKKLREGKTVFGLGNGYPAPGIIEGMCQGWDFVWIDGQHGEFSYDSILHSVQTAMAVGVDSMVRVPSHEVGVLGTYADLAPSAIMIPTVNTPQEARFIVDGLRFPPLGKRSYGGRRIIDLYGRDYYRKNELLVVAQIETPEALKNASEIIRTEGIDLLFFGPDDMKVQMGIPVNTAITESKDLQDAMELTAQAVRKAGKFCGCVGVSPSAVQLLVSMGYQLIVGGGDVPFIRALAAERLSDLRNAAQSVIDQKLERSTREPAKQSVISNCV